jgi:hypothetical protein
VICIVEVYVRSENAELFLRLRGRLRELTPAVSERWKPILEEVLRRHAPVRTGRLRSEIAVETHPDGLRITAPMHMLYLSTGTRPHIIEPVEARALRFEVEGGVVYARRVRHPGFPPHPFLEFALDEALSILPGIVREVLEDAARG